MGESARRPNGASTTPIHPKVQDAPSRKGPSQPKAAGQSNLLGELIKTRKEERRSIRNLAERAGVTPRAIMRMESGKGPVSTFNAVMEALPFPISGLAPGRTLAEQLLNRRIKKGMTIETVAAKASISPNEIVELEAGEGSMDSLLRLLAIIAPKVRRREPERASWGPGRKADRDSRFTPPDFMNSIYRVFGEVDLDPCAHLSSPVEAHRRFFLDQGDDGLRDPWSGRFAYVNPPFSEQLKWLRRAHSQWREGKVETIVCLVPTRTDSEFFQDTVIREADLYLLQGRIKFLDKVGKSQATPFSLMIVAFGATGEQKERFAALVPGCWVSANERLAMAKRVDAPCKSADHSGAAVVPWNTDRYTYSAQSNRSKRLQICCGPS